MSYGGSPGAYELLEKGLIRPSSSLWGCPEIFVKKGQVAVHVWGLSSTQCRDNLEQVPIALH